VPWSPPLTGRILPTHAGQYKQLFARRVSQLALAYRQDSTAVRLVSVLKNTGDTSTVGLHGRSFPPKASGTPRVEGWRARRVRRSDIYH
jgi:hypothetical protein